MLIDIIDNDGKIYINGTKKVLTPLTKDKKFKKALKSIIKELNEQLIIFIEANGFDIKEIQRNNMNLKDILASNKNFDSFISKYLAVQKSIESAQFISENPIYLQRKISKNLDDLKDLVKKLYPEHQPKYKVSNYGAMILTVTKRSFLFTMFIFLVSFLGMVAYILIQEFLIRL